MRARSTNLRAKNAARWSLLTLLLLLSVLLSVLAPAAAVRADPLEAVIVLPEDGKPSFISEVDAARESIRLYLYLLSDDDIIDALIRAHRRDVDVRVILEPEPFGGAQTELETWRRLDAAGINVRWSPGRFRFAHIKLLVIDEQVTVIMNLNMTQAAFSQNREFAYLTTDPVVCEEAIALFDADWSGEPSPPAERIITSPESSRKELLAFISAARHSIDIYAEVLNDAEVVAALANSLDRGVTVRLVMSEIPGASLQYEEPGFLARSGALLYVLNAPYIHAKAIVVDGTSVWLGSQNLTANSMDNNREAGIVFDEPVSVQRMVTMFERDVETAVPLLTPAA